MEIHQSAPYAQYIRLLGWSVEYLGGQAVFLRKIPFLGTIAKFQRFDKIPSLKETKAFLKLYNVKTFAAEPAASVSQSLFSYFMKRVGAYVKINTSPFLPTKTVLVDLTPSEEEIFKNFSEAKRRAVRRAQKNSVAVEESDNIHAMLEVKKRASGLFGFLVVSNIFPLWKTLAPKHATILLAFHPTSPKPLGGILLLFWNKRALYWLVGATKQGKRLFVPTLLAWEAMRISKRRGMKEFDFLGVNDERLPKDNPSWRGFTKFKEGFGGQSLYYPYSRPSP